MDTPTKNQTKKISLAVKNQAMIYETAKMVYDSRVSEKEARGIILETGLKQRSAIGYIALFRAMMKGEEYKTACSDPMTRYFLDRIREDYGDQAQKKAVEAFERHAEYLLKVYKKMGIAKLV
jgi:hypothetical protein